MKIILHKTIKNINIKLFAGHIIEKKYQKRPSVQSDFFKVFTIIIISRSILASNTSNYPPPGEIDKHALYRSFQQYSFQTYLYSCGILR